MALKVCIFDFDGTLVDTMGGFADIAADVLLKHYGLPFEKGRSQYLDTSGIPFFQQLEIICPDGDHNQTCAEEFESRKLEGFFDCAPGDATVTGLNLLRGAGFKLVVSSNNFQHNVDEFLDRHPLPLDLALGFDHNGSEKGRPHFDQVQKHFGIGPDEVLFCGDSLKDGERADGCGVRFVGMTGTFTREQFLKRFPGILTVDTILELAEHLVQKRK
jgi:phosphoglycolate phosphatase-like HAD superfamily hydrolase